MQSPISFPHKISLGRHLNTYTPRTRNENHIFNYQNRRPILEHYKNNRTYSPLPSKTGYDHLKSKSIRVE